MPRGDRLRAIMARHVGSGAMPGLVALVVGRGEVRVEVIGTMAFGGGAPMRRDTLFRIASMTKPIVAAAAMILVEECFLRLDDPVDPLLPELAGRRVLRSVESELDDTVPARRAITLRDLLTMRMGIGAVGAPPGRHPIQRAIDAAGLAPGPVGPAFGPDEFMRRLGALPLVHQPGEAWMYHTASDVIGVLIARATGQPLGDFLRERIFEPLAMRDTGFHVSVPDLPRLPPAYDPTGAIQDPGGPGSLYARPPAFESGSCGLVSTADDYLAFCRMMLNRGEGILSRPSVELMTTDQLTPEQRCGPHCFLGGHRGRGLGVAVTLRRHDLHEVPGRFGWDGGRGTSAYTDPREGVIGVLMTQRSMDSPAPPPAFRDFWTAAYQAITDG